VTADATPLWRNRAFAIFWVAQSLSYTGSQVSEFAIPLTAALVLGAGAGQMGVLSAAELLPPLALSVLAGVLVDRFRRASLLLWCSLGQALLLATIPLAAQLRILTLPQLYAVAFLTASLTLVYGLAATAYIPVLVERRQLAEANSVISLSDAAPSVVGPGLAGVLVQLVTAPIAVAADAISFAVAAVLLLGARRPEPTPAPAGQLATSVRDGVAGFLRRPGLWAPTAAMGCHGLFYGGVLALYVLYVVRELGLTPALLGLVLAVATLGPILGAVAAEPISRRFGNDRAQVVAATLFAGNFLIPLAGGSVWLIVLVLIVARGSVGLGAVFLSITRSTSLQRTVPAEQIGRVNAIVNLVEWGPLPTGSLLGGALGQWLGLRPALIVLAAGGLTALPWVVIAALRGRPAAR
jgi:MFS family permease